MKQTRLMLFIAMCLGVVSNFSFASEGVYTSYFSHHYEAEDAVLTGGCRKDNELFPYVGNGYVVVMGAGSSAEWTGIDVPRSGSYSLIIKYANKAGKNLPCQIIINGEPVATENFKPVFNDWNYFWNARICVQLKEGKNTIQLRALTGDEGLRIDNIAVSQYEELDEKNALNVRDFGAKGDGLQNDTSAIQAAIDACSSGGTVLLTDGVFMSGHIKLKSDMTFWVDQTATLKSIQDTSLYPYTDPPTPNVSVADELGKSFVYSEGAINLRITGGGLIDGNAETEVWSQNRKMDESERPVPIYMAQGTNIVIQNVDVIRSAMWNVVPLECKDVVIDGLNINSTWGKNKDGIDICDSHRVKVLNSTLMVEDDALCPKSGHPMGCEDVIYRNITVNKTECGGVKLGTKTYGYFKNIIFEDIAVFGSTEHKKSNVGINISTVDGADIDGVIVRRVNMRNMSTGVFIMHGAGAKKRIPKGFDFKSGSLKNVLIEDVDIRECHDKYGNWITGTVRNGETNYVTDVVLRNVKVECKGGIKSTEPVEIKEYSGRYPNYNWTKGKKGARHLPAWGYYIRHAKNITFESCNETLIGADARKQYMEVNTENVIRK